jgi:hypothetical protein
MFITAAVPITLDFGYYKGLTGRLANETFELRELSHSDGVSHGDCVCLLLQPASVHLTGRLA